MTWMDENWDLSRVISRVTKRWKDMGGKDPLASWPASSPDMSPLDFSVWANLKWRAIQYSEKGFYKNREEAKECLKKAWADMSQNYIGWDL